MKIDKDVVMEDNIFECEAKRPVVRNGEKVREWRLTRVADVLTDQLDEYRCKDCHGRMKLLGKQWPSKTRLEGTGTAFLGSSCPAPIAACFC